MSDSTEYKKFIRLSIHRILKTAGLISVVYLIFYKLLNGVLPFICFLIVIGFNFLVDPAIIFLYLDWKERTSDCSDPMHPERKLSGKETYGTARLEDPWEYRPYAQIRQIDKCNGIILGQLTEDGSQCIDLFPDPKDPTAHINHHLFAMGCSGSGKTFTFVMGYCFQSIKRHHSVIHTDPKGELFRDTAHLYRENGYVVRRLNFIDLMKTDGWDCLKVIREEKDIDRACVLTECFASAVISNAIGGNPSNIYYSAPLLLLKALILRVVLDDSLPDEKKNMRTVYEWLTNPLKEFLDVKFDSTTMSDKLKRCVPPYTLYKASSGNLEGNIRINLGASIQTLGTGLVAEMLSRDEIDLELPGDRPCAYFIQFPVPNDTYKFPVALFFSMIFKTLTDKAIKSKSGKLNTEVDFVLDEFAQIGILPAWQQYMSVIRSYGLNIFMIVQTIGQFMELYPDSYNTIISNCSTWLMIGANDIDSAKYFSERCGKTSFVAQSEPRQGIRKLLGLGNRAAERVTEGTGQGYLFNPDEITRLPANKALIVFQKHNPILARTVPNTIHPMSKRIKKVFNENEPDLLDIDAKKDFFRKEKTRLESYWKTHTRFVPPDNIDDAPYAEAPILNDLIKDVFIEDLTYLFQFRKKDNNKISEARSKNECNLAGDRGVTVSDDKEDFELLDASRNVIPLQEIDIDMSDYDEESDVSDSGSEVTKDNDLFAESDGKMNCPNIVYPEVTNDHQEPESREGLRSDSKESISIMNLNQLLKDEVPQTDTGSENHMSDISSNMYHTKICVGQIVHTEKRKPIEKTMNSTASANIVTAGPVKSIQPTAVNLSSDTAQKNSPNKKTTSEVRKTGALPGKASITTYEKRESEYIRPPRKTQNH